MPAADQRIRQVAIVLQSLDASTAKSLLGQLPPDMARLVKQAMTKLGTVSASERSQAMSDLQGLLHALPSNAPKKAASRRDIAADSPAAALLAESDRHDKIEWSSGAQHSGTTPNAATDVSGTGVIESELPWLGWEPSSLATLLANERPTVIATVLNQLSPERAKALLDHLPVETAGATLAAIPNLFLVDPSILTDILNEVEKKLPRQQPTPTTATVAGIAKLAAIVEQFQGSQKQAWLKAIAAQNPDVAMQLGWSESEKLAVESEAVATALATNEPNDIFEAPRILSIESHRKHKVESSIASSDEQGPAPEISKPDRSFDDLLRFQDGDLVTLLHSCDRTDVLQALKMSSPEMIQRIERLIPNQDIKKFRDFLRKMHVQEKAEWTRSQETILEQAERLMAAGRIARVDRFTQLAAA
ncbi:MAG: hypothetical protein MUD03_00455 [Pirellula sp.]|nr:hypothetical protein [Pirellula sp.]